MNKACILIVEDEKDLARLLRYNLDKAGYRCVTAADGETALGVFRKESPDLILLDLMIPKLDGYEVCKRIRAESRVPILMLTAKNEEVDRVLGLELGADDYVTKPFSVRELLARVKAILRRTATATEPAVLRGGDVELDPERYECRIDGRTVTLSTKEFDLLKCLMSAGGKAITRDKLLEIVWGYEQSLEIDTRTVDQHVARLRGKLGQAGKRLVTVKNVGYRFSAD